MKKIESQNIKYLTKEAKETQKLGLDFAKKILKINENENSCGAVIIALSGELGGGKTTFLQGFAKGLGVKEKILSPTFVIQKRFSLKKKNFKNFYHIDCYRLNSQKDILELGFGDISNNSQNIIALEWPEKMKGILKGKKVFAVKFKFINQDTREISF